MQEGGDYFYILFCTQLKIIFVEKKLCALRPNRFVVFVAWIFFVDVNYKNEINSQCMQVQSLSY